SMETTMGIFDKIKNAIWGEDEATPAPTVSASAKPVTASASAAPGSGAAAAPAPSAAPRTASPQPAGGPVDVAAILDAAAKASGQKLNWRTSIVDLMKALKLDSSLSARKELADELGYTGDKGD